MAAVTNDRAVLHHREMLAVDHVAISGHGHEDIAQWRGVRDGHDPEAVHHSFNRFNGIHLSDDNVGAHAAGPEGHALTAPAIADHYQVSAGQQDVGSANYSVQGGLPGAVTIIEEVLR